MRVAITGASGFVGRALCARLLRDAHELSGSYATGSPQAQPGLAWHRVDRLEAATDWRPLLQGAEVAVHLAARAHRADSGAAGLAAQRHASVEASLALARQASEMGLHRLIFVSSIGAGFERTPYQIAKREAEQSLAPLCRDLGLELVMLRPPLVVGPRPPGNLARLLCWLERGHPLPLASVQNARSFIVDETLASAIALCLDHPKAAGRLFEIADTPPLSTPGLIRVLARGMGKPARLFPFPPGLLARLLTLGGRAETAAALLGNASANPAEFRRTLDWQPEVALETALMEMARDWVSRKSG